MNELNQTHDPELRSWEPSANLPGTDFPIQNLPFGVFRKRGSGEVQRIGVAIGNQVLNLRSCVDAKLLDGLGPGLLHALENAVLNPLMALEPAALSQLRARISHLLAVGSTPRPELLVPMSEAELFLPVNIGDYTDFYSSIFHARNMGRMFRPDSPLLPNYKYLPVAYHGRSSSIVVSGTPIHRPWGQLKEPQAEAPEYRPSARLDYELEVGAFIGMGNTQGQPLRLADTENHIFGLSLLNDWSARDIQAWEAQPLGPFLAKNFATSISPWIVTLEALAPFRAPAFVRPPEDPQPLPYLFSDSNQAHGGFDLTLEVFLQTADMRRQKIAPARLSRGSSLYMYWTFAQMLAHHSSNGCNLRPGDLLGSGTISGPSPDSLGCLMEITSGGARPQELFAGITRIFLADGDEVIFRGYCERSGYARIGFGECRGIVAPAKP